MVRVVGGVLVVTVLYLMFAADNFTRFGEATFGRIKLGTNINARNVDVNITTPISGFIRLRTNISVLPGFLSVSSGTGVAASTSVVIRKRAMEVPSSGISVSTSFSHATFRTGTGVCPFNNGDGFFITTNFTFNNTGLTGLDNRDSSLTRFVDGCPRCSSRVLGYMNTRLSSCGVGFSGGNSVGTSLHYGSFHPCLNLNFNEIIPGGHLNFH